MESGVGRMFEFGFRETFVVVDCAVADELNLWDARNGFQVRVEDGFLSAFGFVVAMAVALGGRVKGLKERVRIRREIVNCDVRDREGEYAARTRTTRV